MSRSNPSEATQNPSTRWIEWSGERGQFEYYDKIEKKTISLGDKLQFLLLETMFSVTGYHKPSNSGIYSNEVKDTRKDQLVVKSFRGGPLAEGFYGDIKEAVGSKGGKFTSKLYIGYKDGPDLKIGCLSLSGAALSIWMEFSKANRQDIETHAVQFSGHEERVNGRVTYCIPAKISLLKVSDEANEAAIALDRDILQPYLNAYLKKNRSEHLEAQEPEKEDDFTEARKAQAAEWQAAEEEDRRQRSGGDAKLRELANREPYVDSSGIPF